MRKENILNPSGSRSIERYRECVEVEVMRGSRKEISPSEFGIKVFEWGWNSLWSGGRVALHLGGHISG